MSLKHRLKANLRTAYAGLLYHTGLHVLVDRLMPRRMTILFGHCVDAPACNGFLPEDMKIRAENLRRILGLFGRRYQLVGIAEGMERLASGASGPSLVALSMDDGYRDNRTDLLPILGEFGAGATIFLETAPLDGGPLNWSHKFHWILAEQDAVRLAEDLVRELEQDPAAQKVRACLDEGPERLAYRVKRVLKYEAAHGPRDGALDRLFAAAGGDEAALRKQLYLDWDDARALAAAGIELGGHTVHHVILSTLGDDQAQAEIRASREAIEREIGAGSARTFAYPFGRRWDYGKRDSIFAREAGFTWGVNTHAGVNRADSSPMELLRLPIDDRSSLALLVAEACGGFELLRRFGLDLSE